MISSTNSAYNLTIANSASPSYTLKVMTVIAVIFLPLVLVYQSWAYHIFKRRLSVPRVGGDESEAAAPADGDQHARRDLVGASPSVEGQRPGLLCMIPPSAKIVVAVM